MGQVHRATTHDGRRAGAEDPVPRRAREHRQRRRRTWRCWRARPGSCRPAWTPRRCSSACASMLHARDRLPRRGAPRWPSTAQRLGDDAVLRRAARSTPSTRPNASWPPSFAARRADRPPGRAGRAAGRSATASRLALARLVGARAVRDCGWCRPTRTSRTTSTTPATQPRRA
ncbi:MAG: hypothetical protein MZW92_45575 [Comamonadaceae bacterium]|nr:hypothetical protein [Comamonadaceae bacterium]